MPILRHLLVRIICTHNMRPDISRLILESIYRIVQLILRGAVFVLCCVVRGCSYRGGLFLGVGGLCGASVGLLRGGHSGWGVVVVSGRLG